MYDVLVRLNNTDENKALSSLVQNYVRGKSLRLAAGLLGVSHETLRGWQQGHIPDLAFLLEKKQQVVAAYKFLDMAISSATPVTEDLVVAEASE